MLPVSRWSALTALAVVLAVSPKLADKMGTQPVVGGPAGVRAYAGLGAFYQGLADAPDYSEPIDSLVSGSPAVAREAGRYLLALYEQSLVDERNGRAEWRSTPYWGVGPGSQARDFRRGLAEAIGEHGGGSHVIPILEWAFVHEAVHSHLRRRPNPRGGLRAG